MELITMLIHIRQNSQPLNSILNKIIPSNGSHLEQKSRHYHRGGAIIILPIPAPLEISLRNDDHNIKANMLPKIITIMIQKMTVRFGPSTM